MTYFGLTDGRPIAIAATGKRPLWLISIGALHVVDMDDTIEQYSKLTAELRSYQMEAAIGYMQRNDRNETQGALWLATLQQRGEKTEWMLYLESESRARALELDKQISAISIGDGGDIRTATLMVQQRMAYQIRVREPLKIGSDRASIDIPWFLEPRGLSHGDKFLLADRKHHITIGSEAFDYETKSIAIEPAAQSLAKGATLFLVDDYDDFVAGWDGWTIEDTRSKLTRASRKGRSQIDQLVSFYERERSEEEVATEDELPLAIESSESLTPPNSQNESRNLGSTPDLDQWIGLESTPNFVPGDVSIAV